MNKEENNYLNLVEEIVNFGVSKDDRTGVGTKNLFGRTLRFDLSNNKFPILTTRKIKYKNAIEEFLFMLRGEVNSKLLEAKQVNIWRGNTSREFLDKNKLFHFKEGEMGEIYGFNLRNYNGNYKYYQASSQVRIKTGLDQVQNLLNEIQNNPNSRRLGMTTHNPSTTNNAVLHSCHGIWIQFFVNGNELSLSMTQRSCDVILGLPTNILFYSLMLITFSQVCNLIPKELILNLNDVHIYNNHIDKFISLQNLREPKDFSTINIAKQLKTLQDIENLSYEDFDVLNYNSHGGILYEMAI